MNIYNKEMNSVLAILGTIFTWLFGAWDLSLMILVIYMNQIKDLFYNFINNIFK